MKVIIESGFDTGGLQVRYGDQETDTVIGNEIVINVLHRDGNELIEIDRGVTLTKDNARLLRAAIELFINN